MSASKSSVALLVGIVLALLLAACAAPPAALPAAPSPTEAPTATSVPPTATPVPATATPVLSTATPEPTATVEPTAEAAAAFPVTLTDDLGREITVAARPERIVSMAPSITEVLFAVGAGPQVTGVTKYCSYPPDAQTGREIVGGFSAKSLSVETIVSLKPDLVFAAGGSHQTVTEALEAAGLTVVNFEPTDLDGVYANLLAAGQLTGNAAQAEEVVAEMRGRVEKVTAAVADIPEDARPTVFYEVWDEPLMTAGPTTLIGQVITLAGARNIFDDVTEQWPTVSAEAVVARNPQVIVGPSSHGEGLTREKIGARPGWAALPAVQNGAIVIVDGDTISRSGPRIADALEAVAAGLHPERFK
jgi:iron complex transport system substrate-binding protein